MTARRCALIVAVSAAIGFALVAAIWVPWHPVPGGAPGAVRPDSVFTAEQIGRGEDYAAWARRWSLLSLVINVAVASVLGFSRWGAALMTRLPGRWWAKIVLGVLALSLVGRLATLPCSVMLQRHRLANGLSTQSWVGYARDVATSEAITVVTTSLALLVLLGVARRWTRTWPAIAAGLVAALVVLGSFVYPLVVEPLFNDFRPLPDGELRSDIFALADQEDVRIDDVLVADASRRTTTLNAYVSGFGGTRRVVVYDNLVESLPRDEALSVVAHELAHAGHGDVLIGTALGGLGGATGVGFLAVLVTAGSGRRRTSMADPRVVPLVLALSVWATLAASPLQSAISRQIETRADVVALTTTQDPDAFIAMQRTLALRSLADPTPPPWLQWWWGSHPTTLERVALARTL
ncbi:M48 family metallopeptidase [Nocardioides sp.]|uniref:M48 family metallopeptidase n=1 Tax=Nocardioides sp. TaxID=35761 RepID=UPI00286D96BD|nr:M48 family metallopeptidase [Nocardioides sp.]